MLEKEFLYCGNDLKFENSIHYILNYQWMHNKRIFRIELFDKEYNNLVRNISSGADAFNNSGTGYARGIDLFWRDKNSIPNAEYWISYSFLDTKRIYLDFPVAAAPCYTSKHNLSVVYKHWMGIIDAIPGCSYTFVSGRPYFNPNRPDSEFNKDRTNGYHNLDINISKMFTLWKRRAVIYASVNNVPGLDHVFGYQYSRDGSVRIPVKPSSVRSFFIGLFVSTY